MNTSSEQQEYQCPVVLLWDAKTSHILFLHQVISEICFLPFELGRNLIGDCSEMSEPAVLFFFC